MGRPGARVARNEGFGANGRHRSSIPRGVDCGGYEEVRRTSLVGTDRLVRALAVEMHENWLEATRYLNMNHLKAVSYTHLTLPTTPYV